MKKIEAVVVSTASLLLRELCVIDGEKWQKALLIPGYFSRMGIMACK
jgi:hypothetical protein